MNFNATAFLSTFYSLRDGHVRYEIGEGLGKVRRLTSHPSTVTGLDCSGFVQYMIYRSTDPQERVPAGSWYQEQFFRNNHYVEVPYADHAWRNDDVVRIGFRDRTDELIRHVWLVINGFTYESTTRGGRDGPTSFHWSARSDQADSFYIVGRAANFLWAELTGSVRAA
jgi:hypothetical protein